VAKNIERMRRLLVVACDAAYISGAPTYDANAKLFRLPGSSVEIALELGSNGYVYRLREIYEVPDLQAGGARPVRNELATLPVGSEVEVARRAVVHLVGSRVNSALDAAA
jgi:hypothetical protein